MSDTEETPAETIERLTRSNNRLAQMVKASSDRLQESARELMAQGWERGYTAGHSIAMRRMSDEPGAPTPPNPYRQPINLPGATK